MIEGLGGIGKTQLAIEAAYRVRDANLDCSVFWVPAVSTVMFENACRDIGRALGIPGIPGIEDDRADVKGLVKEALSRDDASDWLLIVDMPTMRNCYSPAQSPRRISPLTGPTLCW